VFAQAAGFAVLAALSPTALLVMAVFLGSANPRTTARPRPATAFAVGLILFVPSATFIAAVQVVATAGSSSSAASRSAASHSSSTAPSAWRAADKPGPEPLA
jgi:hypothetical protein